jgi:hypothetical protein
MGWEQKEEEKQEWEGLEGLKQVAPGANGQVEQVVPGV